MRMADYAAEVVRLHGSWPTMTDKEILGTLLQPGDRGHDFVSGRNNYLYWYAIGRVFQPRAIAEMGVRFGYSLWSMWLGSDHAARDMSLWCFDDERDGENPPALTVMEYNFRRAGFVDLYFTRKDTQSLTTLGIPHLVDLVSVDAWHTEAGVYHECGLALAACKPGGVIVVDDAQPGCVRDGCEKFVKDHKLDAAYVPSFRGTVLIRVPG